MRRISWSDERTSARGRQMFFRCGGERIGFVTDARHHGEGQHHQRDMPVPAVPGPGFVVVKTEFVLGGLEAVLDGPAMAFDGDQR